MAEKMTFLPKEDLLTLEELDIICSNFINLGVTKLRVTGGEPLVRKGIIGFLSSISRHLVSGKLKELTLTTNGSQLYKLAQPLVDLGVKRINISLDSLKEEKFRKITRWGNFNQVIQGIREAKTLGLAVKINTVALKGFNEDEVHDFVKWCGDEGFDLTFIEVMPMGDLGTENRLSQYWSLKDLRTKLEEKWTLSDLTYRTGGPARYAKVHQTGGRIGFITPLTHNFCESCNRVRVTCTGQLFMCLGQDDESDLRRIIRKFPNDNSAIRKAIRTAISRKPKGHDFDYSRTKILGQMNRHMSTTGG